MQTITRAAILALALYASAVALPQAWDDYDRMYTTAYTTRWLFDLWGTTPVADVAAMGWQDHPAILTEYAFIDSWLSDMFGDNDMRIWQFGLQGRYIFDKLGAHPFLRHNRFSFGEATIFDEYGNIVGTMDEHELGTTLGIGVSYRPTPYTVFSATPKAMFTEFKLSLGPFGGSVVDVDNTWLLLDLGASLAYQPWLQLDASFLNIGGKQNVFDENDERRTAQFLRFVLTTRPVRYLRIGYSHVTGEEMYLLHHETEDKHNYGAIELGTYLPFDLFSTTDGAAEMHMAIPVENLPDSYPYDNGLRYGLSVAFRGFSWGFDATTVSGNVDETAYIFRMGYDLRR